ncbi:MAG: PorV/PorQ family protein [Elusimicrobia bacterium]|nr:PorV/PorQ family protein [Elusimicrobiota bacterium]
MNRSLLCLVGLALAASSARGLEAPGTTAASILQVPMGSRALGMGGAFTAVADDHTALHYNPAGLSQLKSHEVGASFLSGQTDTSSQHFAYGGPIPFGGLAGEGFSSVGGSVLYSRGGEIELNELAPDGSLRRSDTISAGYDVVVAGGYSERLGMTPIESGGKTYNINHFVGGAGKLIHSSLAERYSATAVAGDLGYLATCPDLGVSLGFAAANLGGKMRFVESSDPLPATIRMGTAYLYRPLPTHDLLFSADGDYLFYDRLWHAAVGMEYFWNRMFGFRLGWQLNRQVLGLTAGLGMQWKQRFSFDYAWAAGSAGNNHRFTFGYRFGGIVQSSRSRTRRPFIEVSTGQDDMPANAEVIEVEEKPRKKTKQAPPRDDRPSGVPGWLY